MHLALEYKVIYQRIVQHKFPTFHSFKIIDTFICRDWIYQLTNSLFNTCLDNSTYMLIFRSAVQYKHKRRVGEKRFQMGSHCLYFTTRDLK